MMASFTFIRLLALLLFFSIIFDQIDGIYLYDSQETIHRPRAVKHYYNNKQRSVLWPKICMDLLKQHANQRVREQMNKHYSHRLGRKCYPFDIQ